MKLPFVARSELDVLWSEREEWRRRAELALPGTELERASGSHTPPRGRWMLRLVVSAVLALGVGLGASAAPDGSGASRRTDYSACIGRARYQHPIRDNQYQELVNALYACGVYRAEGRL